MNDIKKNDLINFENAIRRKHILRNEEDIINKWSGDPSTPTVSIFCATYNQELYIEDTIRGFLIQETDFPFEVLIHDDASTDTTPQIIKKYEKAYPRIIKPIYQKKNQYSKGIKISSEFQLPRARGKFIALCEGDDFWIDQHKLAKQLQALEEHPQINICFSSALSLLPNGETQKMCKYNDDIYTFSVENVIEGGGGFMPTCSLLVRRHVYSKLPKWYETIAPIGDYFIQILASIDEGAIYIPDSTCVYRVNAIGSWSIQSRLSSTETYVSNRVKVIYCLNEINASTNYKYDKSFKKIIALIYFKCATRYLNISDYPNVKKYIELSWISKKNLSPKQILLKRLAALYPIFRKYQALKQYYKK